jgi:hypothetical protein
MKETWRGITYDKTGGDQHQYHPERDSAAEARLDVERHGNGELHRHGGPLAPLRIKVAEYHVNEGWSDAQRVAPSTGKRQ